MSVISLLHTFRSRSSSSLSTSGLLERLEAIGLSRTLHPVSLEDSMLVSATPDPLSDDVMSLSPQPSPESGLSTWGGCDGRTKSRGVHALKVI
ncbi:hypothetical protein Mapa_000883 [Marchantia paleacea]|nr:hypothetical protein Mapa_000883 [Marchantia paleacea]